jgi:membrane protein implicated in regulation of membrane protease activity
MYLIPSGMYLIPIVLIVILALIAVAWSPIFALVLFAIGFVVFLAVVARRPRADEKLAPPEQPGTQPRHDDGTKTGVWGERRPS